MKEKTARYLETRGYRAKAVSIDRLRELEEEIRGSRPTYLNAEAKDAEAGAVLGRVLAPEGFRVAPVAVPKKLLAVRSALARYGGFLAHLPGGLPGMSTGLSGKPVGSDLCINTWRRV